MTPADGYLLDNQQNEAGRRFDAFATLFDPMTFRHLEGLGVGPGWRCWEAGAGGTSVVSWLAEQVGPAGQVVATDIDTSRLTPAARRWRPPSTTWVPTSRRGRASTWSTPGWSSSMCPTGKEP